MQKVARVAEKDLILRKTNEFLSIMGVTAFVCSKETDRMGVEISEMGMLPWCEQR